MPCGLPLPLQKSNSWLSRRADLCYILIKTIWKCCKRLTCTYDQLVEAARLELWHWYRGPTKITETKEERLQRAMRLVEKQALCSHRRGRRRMIPPGLCPMCNQRATSPLVDLLTARLTTLWQISQIGKCDVTNASMASACSATGTGHDSEEAHLTPDEATGLVLECLFSQDETDS